MRMRKISAVLVLLLASACVTPGGTSRWIHPEGLGEDAREAAKKQCWSQAERKVPASGTTAEAGYAFSQCMQERGWRLTSD